jgi:hypothetical protein
MKTSSSELIHSAWHHLIGEGFVEVDLLGFEDVLVMVLSARGTNLESILEPVSIKLHEQPAECQMIGRDETSKLRVTKISEGGEYTGSKVVIEVIH